MKSRLSRLELCLEILNSLVFLKLSKIVDIQEKINIEQSLLQNAMCFLERQNLVNKETIQNEILYKTTPRGDRITRFFNQEEAQKMNFQISNNDFQQKNISL